MKIDMGKIKPERDGIKDPDPVFEKDGKWHFWDETYADSYGPFDIEKEAREELDRYCREELGYDTEGI